MWQHSNPDIQDLLENYLGKTVPYSQATIVGYCFNGYGHVILTQGTLKAQDVVAGFHDFYIDPGYAQADLRILPVSCILGNRSHGNVVPVDPNWLWTKENLGKMVVSPLNSQGKPASDSGLVKVVGAILSSHWDPFVATDSPPLGAGGGMTMSFVFNNPPAMFEAGHDPAEPVIHVHDVKDWPVFHGTSTPGAVYYSKNGLIHDAASHTMNRSAMGWPPLIVVPGPYIPHSRPVTIANTGITGQSIVISLSPQTPLTANVSRGDHTPYTYYVGKMVEDDDVDLSRYPDKCRQCGGSSYNGSFTGRIDCLKKCGV